MPIPVSRLLPIAACAGLLASAAFAHGPAIGQVAATRGGLSVQRGQAIFQALPGEPVSVHDMLKTATGGASLLQLDKGRVSIAASSDLALVPQESTGGKVYFCFDNGSVRVSVEGGAFEVDLGGWILKSSKADFVLFKSPQSPDFWFGVISGSVSVHPVGEGYMSPTIVGARCDAVLSPGAPLEPEIGSLRMETDYWLRRIYPLAGLRKLTANGKGLEALAPHPRELRAP